MPSSSSCPGGHAPDHEPRAARAGRGGRRPARPAPDSRRRAATRPAARRRRRRRVPRPRPPRAPRPRDRPPTSSARSPRSCVGWRACRWPSSWPPGRLSTFSPGRARRAARPGARPARQPWPARPAPHAAGDRRVVLRPAQRRGAAPVPAPVGVRRRRRPRRGGGGGRRARARRRRRGPAGAPRRRVDGGGGARPSAGRTRYRLLETLRAYGRDRLVAAGEDDAADRVLVRWAVELAAWAEQTSLTAREAESAPVLRRELGNLRAAWRLARGRGDLDAAVVHRGLAAGDRLLAGPARGPRLGRRAGRRPGTGRAPVRGARVGRRRPGRLPARGRLAGRASRPPRARAAARRRGAARLPGRPRPGGPEPWAPGTRPSPTTSRRSGLADRPRTRAGRGCPRRAVRRRPRRARELAGLMPAADVPSLLGLAAYVAAEIDSVEGHTDAAEEGTATAIAHARSVGSTFLEAIAAVGLASLRLAVRADRGRARGVPRGDRALGEGGNWSHQWVTLRNLADLLRDPRRRRDGGPARRRRRPRAGRARRPRDAGCRAAGAGPGP